MSCTLETVNTINTGEQISNLNIPLLEELAIEKVTDSVPLLYKALFSSVYYSVYMNIYTDTDCIMIKAEQIALTEYLVFLFTNHKKIPIYLFLFI